MTALARAVEVLLYAVLGVAAFIGGLLALAALGIGLLLRSLLTPDSGSPFDLEN